MSDELKQFYREIWAWIQAGFPKHPAFSKGLPLSCNLEMWASLRSRKGTMAIMSEQSSLIFQWTHGGASSINVNFSEFAHECETLTLYENPKRLAFIEEHAK